MRLAALAGVLLLAGGSQAGTYAVNYGTGGTVAATGYATKPYTTTESGRGGSGVSNPYGPVTCSGQLTSTFTWQPAYQGEEPPDKVIVKETCTASWSGDSGNCSNGLGFAESGHTSTGSRYSIRSSPGQSFTVTCSPSAYATTSGSGSPARMQHRTARRMIVPNVGTVNPAIASVHYSAQATPLEIVLSGGIGTQSQHKYLVGQRCSATIASVLQPTSYTWSTSGGRPFANYVVAAPQNDPMDFAATLTALTSLTGSSFAAYYAKPESASLTCAVHLPSPSGSLPAAGLDVTLSRNFQVEAPTFTSSEQFGTVQISGSNFTLAGVHFALGQYSGTYGVVFPSSVTTPAAYTSGGTDYGGWNVVQTVVLGRRREKNGQTERLKMDNLTEGADNSYPYADNFGQDWTANGTQPLGLDGAPLPTDTPSETLDNSATAYHIDEHFKMYVMYKPPGVQSRYVPLKVHEWYWKGDATLTPPNSWSLTAPGAACGGHTDYPNHPQWAHVLNPVWRQVSWVVE